MCSFEQRTATERVTGYADPVADATDMMAASVSGDRPGTFHVELYNALYTINSADIKAKSKVEIQER